MEHSYANYIKMITVGTLFFGAMDIFWLGFLQKSFYRNQLGSLLRHQYLLSHKVAAVAVWLLIVLGCIFYVLPQTTGRSIKDIFVCGALYGVVLYGVYNFTNYAVLTNYPAQVMVRDIVWGGFATGTLTLVLQYIASL